MLKVEPTVNPGTYYETVTATDSVGATKSLGITVTVAPGPSILGTSNLISARGFLFRSPAYSVANGIAPFTYTLTSTALSPSSNVTTGISFDTSTMTIRVSSDVLEGTYLETLTVRDSMGAVGRFSVNLQVKPPVVLSGDMSIEKTYGDLSVTNYTASYATGIPPFTFTSSTSSVNSVCAPITGTYIGDGTNGTLGVSYTYEKFTGLQRCNWIIPQGVTSADYVVVGSGGGGGTGRGGGGGGAGVAAGSGLTLTPGSVYEIAVASPTSGQNDGAYSWISKDGTQLVVAAGGGAGGSMSTDVGEITGNNGASASATVKSAGGSGGGGGNNFNNGSPHYGAGGVGGIGTVTGNVGGNSYRCDPDPLNSYSANSDGDFFKGSGGRTTGGGGGAGGAGVGFSYATGCPTYASNPPNGGPGISSRLTGSVETYGGGGGGADGRTEATPESTYRSTGRGLGNGGGGDGASFRDSSGTLITAQLPTAGTPNTGGGGGGGIHTSMPGGSGVVVVRYVTPVMDTQTVTLNTVSNGLNSIDGSVTLTIPQYTPVGSITSKLIRLVQSNGTSNDYTVNVTINKATPTVTLSLPGGSTSAKYGSPVQITATTSTAGSVTFKFLGANISSCLSVATVNNVATCNWVPTTVGSKQFGADFVPTDTNNYENASAVNTNFTLSKADTLTVTAGNESFTFVLDTPAPVTSKASFIGLVGSDSITAVSMIYTGTANDGSSYANTTAPTLAGTYSITPNFPTQTSALTYTNIDSTVAARICRQVPPGVVQCTGGDPVISDYYESITVVSGTLTINRATPTITFAYPDSNTVTYTPTGTYSPSAVSRSGTGVGSVLTTTPETCSIDALTGAVSTLSAGNCGLVLNVDQDPNYLAGSNSINVVIEKASRTVTLTAPVSTLKYTETTTVTTSLSGGSGDGIITYSLNSTPGCSFDGLSGLLTATSGTQACTLNATVAEGANYLAASTTSNLSITTAKADAPVVTIETLTAVDYVPGQRAQISVTYAVTGFKGTDAASSVTLTYALVSTVVGSHTYSSTTVPTDAGTYSITPSALVMDRGLLSNYNTPNYASSAITFVINRIAQAPITFDNVNGEVDVPFALVARGGSSTGAASFAVVSGATCLVLNGELRATTAGKCVLTVTRAEDRNYLSITSDTVTVSVRNFVLTPIFVFGNGSTGISLATNTTLTKGESRCTVGCVPTLTGISPAQAAPGEFIVLTGTEFADPVRVIFNSSVDATTVTIDSDTQITVEVPAGLVTSGDDYIEVETPGGTTSSLYGFTVLPTP